MTFSRDCLNNKNILITGGLGAIGKVVVSALVSHSARVLVHDILPPSEGQAQIAEAGWRTECCTYMVADVTKPDQAQ